MSKSTYSSKNERSSSSGSYESGQYDAKIGEKFKNGQYEIIKWLGNGTFSKVWLAKDYLNKNHCALKIQSLMYSEAAADEIEMLKIVNDNEKKFNFGEIVKNGNAENINTHCVKLLDSFVHIFDDDAYYCMVMEILGPTLLDLIQYYEARNTRMEIELAKEICRQILVGLIYIHEVCTIVHTDIKPENIMIELDEKQMKQLINDEDKELQQKKVKLNEQEDIFIWKDNVIIKINNKLQFKIVDFGNACLFSQQFEEIQTKEYKSPESIIKAKYSGNTDIWSFACVTFEILTNNYLFNPEGEEEQDWTDNLLAMMIDLIGQPDQSFIKTGERSNVYFDSTGQLKRIDDLEHIPLSYILIVDYNFKEEEAKEIEDFIMYQLVWDPKHRPKAVDVFQHKWLQKQQNQKN